MPQPANQRTHIFAIQPESPFAPSRPGHDHFRVADNAQRHRLRQSHRAAHRQHVVPGLNLRGIPKAGRFELDRARWCQPKHRDVGKGVGADQFRLDFFAIPQGAKDAHRMSRHMMIGHQVTIAGNDHSAADRLRLGLPPLAVVGLHDANPDQGRFHFGNGRLDLRIQFPNLRAAPGAGVSRGDHH